RFLGWLAVLIVVLALLAVLHHRGVTNLPALDAARTALVNAETGRETVLSRLSGMGIFHDPNDLCLVLVTGMAIALYGLGDRRLRWRRFLWAAPLALFGHALTLTHSLG